MSLPSTSFVQQFQDTITLLAQQLNNRLRGCVMVDTNWRGDAKYYDAYNEDTMTEIVSRLQDTPLQDPDHSRRKITPRHFVSNTLQDPNEALAMLVDPKSTYMQAKQAAVARKIDSIIIDALGGTAYSGVAGATEVTLGSPHLTSVGGGMLLVKIVEAKKILDSYEVDTEDRFLAYTAAQLQDLLNVTTNTSIDYNSVKALVQGEIDTWVGFKFVHTEQLSKVSTNRYCYAWQKKGMQLAMQKEPEGRLTERPDKNYAWQVYIKMALGATRLEEDRVVKITCVEA